MALDPYWDKPEYTPTTLIKLQTERNLISTALKAKKEEIDSVWALEQELKLQLAQAMAKRRELNAETDALKSDYDKISTIEIDFAENVRKAQELADLENKISELENRLRALSEGRDFWDKLMPYQKEDLLYMINAWDMGLSGVLNANDMGLGKTFETISFDFLAAKLFEAKHGRKPRRIWVTKKSLVKSSVREIKKWFPDTNCIPLVGTTAAQRNFLAKFAIDTNAMLICNYEALTTTEIIHDVVWDFVYADEVHRLKGGASNKPTKLWVAMRDLVAKTRLHKGFFVPLSGSPIQNHPKEMWAYLHLFDPIRFDNVNRFEQQWCSGWSKGLRVNFDLLIKAMRSQTIRRTMPEVKHQLSQYLKEPIYDVREIELLPSQKEVYLQMRENFFVWLDEAEEKALTATVIIAQLNRLRQFTLWPDKLVQRPVGSAKIDEAMDIIDELVNAGEQVVVFSSQYNDPLYEIVSRCNEPYEIPCGIIAGATKDVDDLCEKFRQGELKVLCINAKSGGEGLNLQKSNNWPGGASHVIMLDKWWNPKFNEQAIARVYRTGQTDVVTIHELYAVDTVDAYIEQILGDKTMMIDSIMEVKDLRKSKSDWKNSLKDVI